MGKQRIAFDIGESSVKMIHVSGKEIRNAAVAELPDNMVENGRILSPDAMADFIRENMKAGNLPKAEAAVILPASLMFVRSVTVPLMTAQQLEFNLPYEFKDYLREEKSKYLFDYAVSEIIRDEESVQIAYDNFADRFNQTLHALYSGNDSISIKTPATKLECVSISEELAVRAVIYRLVSQKIMSSKTE